jgi:hypothetical protein
MLIGSGAPTLHGPLPGMKSSLVTTSSLGPPSDRTRYLALAQKQNTGLLPMVLQRLVGFTSYSWSCTLLYPTTHLSIVTMSVPSTWRSTSFSINARSMSRLISTSSVTRFPLGKFVFYMSQRLLGSSTSSLNFAPVSTSIVTRVGTARAGV